IDFSIPYRKSTFVLIVNNASNFATATKLTEFKGAKLTAQQGTLHYDLIKQLVGAKRLTAMRDFSVMRQSLASGTIDGYVAEDIEYQSYHRVNPNIVSINLSKMPHFHVNYNDSITSIGVKKGNTKLLNQVNQILKTISDNKREKLMSFAIKQQPQVATTKKTNWFVSIMHRYGKMILN
ncbi:MAG: transporter substrate-binding domain-containing protein, partial [Lactobacillus iners]|nr:transporter substrate-binding domain-containing protein [Lactobacillus iners]